MGYHCSGSAFIKGDMQTLKAIEELLDSLVDCAKASGFDSDEDWLPNIFTTQVSEEGIFEEGHDLRGDTLEVYIRTYRTTGEEFFEEMAKQLGIEITWDYVPEYENKERTYTYNVDHKEHIGSWQLRVLDGDNPDDEESGEGGNGYSFSSKSSAVRPMSLDGVHTAFDGARLNPSDIGPTYTPETIKWRDIEAQLKLAATVWDAFKFEHQLDFELVQMVKNTAIARVYAAAKLLYIKYAEYDLRREAFPMWDTFCTALKKFDSFFPRGLESITFIEPLHDLVIDATEQSWAIKLFEMTKQMYIIAWPRRRSAVAPIRLS